MKMFFYFLLQFENKLSRGLFGQKQLKSPPHVVLFYKKAWTFFNVICYLLGEKELK